MNLYVYSTEKERLGEVRGISSLQWLEGYRSKQSEVKLVCGATDSNRTLLQYGNLLYNTDRPGLLARIVDTEIDDNAKTAKLTVRAKMTAACIDDRVVYYTETYTNAEKGMLDIVSHNLRGLLLAVAPAKGYAEQSPGQVSWGSVLDAVDSIASAFGLGYRVTVGPDMAETFEVYKGSDRSVPGSPDYIGFFGKAAGNLDSIQIKDDKSGVKNVAIVCGQGEGAARRMVEVDLSGGGERRELYVDARDLAPATTGPDGAETTLTDAEYDALLYARGLAKLAETAGGLTVKSELKQSMLLFGKDYDLGDILPLRVEKHGVNVNVRVIKINLIYEKTKSIKATLEVVV